MNHRGCLEWTFTPLLRLNQADQNIRILITLSFSVEIFRALEKWELGLDPRTSGIG